MLGINRQIKDRSKEFPLIVPTSGIAPRTLFLYTGPIKDGFHEGIDIWTNEGGFGMNPPSYYKGNPVYSSCDGVVRKIIPENGDVSVICDEIDALYDVPARKIKVLYGHVADKNTKEVFIYVKEGDRVKQGDFLGYQGNLSMYAPHNLMVHLHFGIYDISVNPQMPVNPEKYIGVSCTTLNQLYTAGI